MSFAKKSFQVAQLCRRQLSITKIRAAAKDEIKIADYSRLKEKQKRFQIDDGVPVYLKGGIADKLLYHATLGLLAFGLVLSGEFVYRLINK